MAALTVPTIFTAVDRLSGVVDRMKRSVGGFAGKASIGVNALNKGVNNLIPSFGRLGSSIKSLVNYGIGAALFTGIGLSLKAIVDYEKEAARLHSILSQLSDTGFVKYQDQIKKTAWQTKKSAVDVAAAYANIAELNPDLAQTPKLLDQVARSAILLSKASGIPLSDAANTLVTIMTQFRLGADQADRIVNTLAAGNKFGAAPIDKAAEALTKFASVARRANMTIEQSNALIQVLAAGGFQGAEAGTAIKSAIVHMQRHKATYSPGGTFDITVAMKKVMDFYNSQKTEFGKNTFLEKLFGLHQIARAGEMVSSLEKINALIPKLTGTDEATAQAGIRMNTLANRFEELKNRFYDWLISNNSMQSGLERLKGILVYVADNIDKIIDRVLTFIKWFLILKGVIWTVQLALFAYNVVLGVTGALTGVCNIAIGESTIALGAYRLALLLTGRGSLVFGASTAALSTGMGTVTTGFMAAEGAAAGFFATLSAFVLPAAVVGAIAFFAYNRIRENTHHDVNAWDAAKKPNYLQDNMQIWQRRKDVKEAMKIKDAADKANPGFRPFNLGKQADDNEKKYKALGGVPFGNQAKMDSLAAADPGILHITVDDKGGIIKDMKHNGKPIIPNSLHQTSTTNNR